MQIKHRNRTTTHKQNKPPRTGDIFRHRIIAYTERRELGVYIA
jgi:hypothetical protein